MTDSRYFDRLLETTELIVRHADYPGKMQVVERCQEEVEELIQSGRITAAQGETLSDVLFGLSPQKA
jgi:hypothetical protein